MLAAHADLEPVSIAYTRYADELRRFAQRRVRDPEAAADIVHESYLHLALEARSGRFPRQPRPWLFRTALNLVISGSRRATVARAAAPRLLGSVVDHQTPEALVLARERRISVNRALRAVSSNGQAGLVMASEGYSGREIARSIDRSEVATRALMRRARIAVREELIRVDAV